jgi:hypothetical protein
MRVLRAVITVDELPKSCKDCTEFFVADRCVAMSKNLEPISYKARPEWCPLYIEYIDEALANRFWAKVDKSDSEKCWNWKAYHDKDGYAYFRYHDQQRPAARFSWLIHFGHIPDDLYVLHKCDNRSCVNPNHLWVGSQYANMHDCISKGRHVSSSLSMELQGEVK